ncbi:hypothetical protein D9M73_104850 [compost metagenome]
MRCDVGECRRHQLLGCADQFVHQLQFCCLARVEEFALEYVGLCAHQAQQPGHLGDAGGAGHEAQRDFGQAELDLGAVHGDAVVADKRDFPATAQCRAVEATHHRNAQCFQCTEVFFHVLDFGEHGGRIGGCEAHRGLQVGAGEETALGRGEYHTLELCAVGQDAGGDFAQVGLPLAAHGVDAGARFIKSDQGDLAAGCVQEFVANGLHEFLSWSVIHVVRLADKTSAVQASGRRGSGFARPLAASPWGEDAKRLRGALIHVQ